MRLLALVAIVIAAPAAAQPVPCVPCARGDELIGQLGLEPLRALVLSDLQLGDPLTKDQYARIIEMRKRTPALVKLGAVDDVDLASIAVALCRGADAACTVPTAHALHCLADRCEVALPMKPELVVRSECQPRTTLERTAPLGVGVELGTGWHRSRYPTDGRAISLGLEARLRLGKRIGTVARIDRIGGRDATTDTDDNGEDDVWTGSITRISALAGPSFILQHGRWEDEPRFLQVDLLGGYVSTRSQVEESGPAVGVDLSYQLWIFRIGARFVQGFSDARDTSTYLVHVGIVAGASPPERDYDADCDTGPSRRRDGSTRLAIGFDYGVIGYGLAELGAMALGPGIELAWYLWPRIDLLARGDLLLYPGYERDRVVHQALLAGVRLDGGSDEDHREKTGWIVTVLGGYSHSAGFTPTTTPTGPITDLSLGYGIQAPDAAAFLRLHARFGISPDNVDYRAIFLSGGFELRLDRKYWRHRS